MSTEYPGNVLSSPGVTDGPTSADTEILASTVGLRQFGVTLKAGQGILPAGTVLGRLTASKLYVLYNNSNSNGEQVARGILRQAVDTGTNASGPTVQGNIVVSGLLVNSKISGADAGSITDLGSVSDTVRDTFKF